MKTDKQEEDNKQTNKERKEQRLNREHKTTTVNS